MARTGLLASWLLPAVSFDKYMGQQEKVPWHWGDRLWEGR